MPKQTNSSIEKARQSLLKCRSSQPHAPSSSNARITSSTIGDDEFVVDVGFEETMQLISKSWAGTATVDGEPCISWLTSDFKFPSLESKVQTSYVLGRCVGAEAFAKDPLILGCKQKDQDQNATNTGTNVNEVPLATAVVVQEYDPVLESRWWVKWMNKIRLTMAIVGLIVSGRVPDVLKSSQYKREQKHIKAKIDVLEVVPSWHLQHGPQRKHWYVNMVGSDPACQGRGYGKKTMLRLGALADEHHMECYLECGNEKNRRFYEKCRYQVVSAKTVADPTDDPTGKPLTLFLMVRPPKITNQRNMRAVGCSE